MKYTIRRADNFKRALKRCLKRGLKEQLFREVVTQLATTDTLPDKYHPHKLIGKYAVVWECHIQPDWLLVWEQNDTELTLLMVDTGTHSDLFG